MKRCAMVLCVLSSAVISQGVALQMSPDPLPVGGTLSVTLTESNGVNITFLTSCVFTSVHTGTPNGPIASSVFCAQALSTLGPHGTRSQTWTPPTGMGPGLYYLKVVYRPAGPPITEWFPITILDPAQPLLSAANNARVGQTLLLSLSDPASPGVGYLCAGSITTNQGFNATPTVFCSLDMDSVFALSYPSPLTSVFSGFQGVLDGNGGAGLSVHCPNFPPLANTPFHVQGVVLGAAGQVALTNPLSFTILP
jgi:hypothetical protein